VTAVREVAAVVLLRSDGAALLQHRDNKPGLRHADMWTPPGGHRDPGESLEECARREFAEETGYHLGALAWVASVLDDADTLVTMFWSRYDDRQDVACYEGQDLAFIRRQDADSRRIPAYLIDLWDRALAAADVAGAHPMPQSQ